MDELNKSEKKVRLRLGNYKTTFTNTAIDSLSLKGQLDKDKAEALLMLMFTGRREQETLKLKWSDVNFEKGTITMPNGNSVMLMDLTRLGFKNEAKELANSLNGYLNIYKSLMISSYYLLSPLCLTISPRGHCVFFVVIVNILIH